MPRPAKAAAAALPAETGESAKISTQQRVLDVSSELFNLYGIEAVSIQQIAEALHISPGNLTYHYKKKSDLVAEHLAVFETELNKGIRGYPTSHDPHVQAMAFNKLLRLTLRYRFLFVGANFIIQYELAPPARYAALITRTKRSFAAQIRRLTAAGVLRRISPPYSIALLVDSIWTLWIGAILDAQIKPAGSRPTDEMLVVDIAIRILFLIYPYTDKPFFDAVHGELQALRKKAQRRIPSV